MPLVIQNFLILGGGFCSIAQTQIRFSANIHGPIEGAVWRRAKFVRSGSFQSVNRLSGLVGSVSGWSPVATGSQTEFSNVSVGNSLASCSISFCDRLVSPARASVSAACGASIAIIRRGKRLQCYLPGECLIANLSQARGVDQTNPRGELLQAGLLS